MESISGVIERITYSDQDSGFSVLKAKCKGYSELVTLIGNLSSLSIGTVVLAKGNWSLNPKFGKQFNVQFYEEKLPANIYGIEKYLGSGLIRGIGPKFAKLIVKTFGADTLNIIDTAPERLIEIPNIGNKRVALISNAWKEQKDIKKLMMFLQEYGVSTTFGYKIYKVYGNESINRIKNNPYSLADDVYGIGFKTADIIASKLGISKDSYNRCRAGIFYILNYVANTLGHCYLPTQELIDTSAKMLDVEHQKIIMTINDLVNNKEIFDEDGKIYLLPYYYSEVGIAKRIREIMNCKIDFLDINSPKIADLLSNKYYDDVQISAIKLALSSKVSIITGGPGVGKTTITKAIINVFSKFGKKILLAAPTGRAAKRMSEACGMEAKTIHRLLGRNSKDSPKNFMNLVTGDVLIIDESSMIDLLLMYNLLKVLPDTITIIFIGDIDQLPSVGAGSVLKDLIECDVIPVVKLKKIYRQSKNSDIIINSHKINNGVFPNLSNRRNSDFFFIDNDDQEQIVHLISDLVSKRLPNKYNVNPINDIQILTPMKKGQTGTDNLNIIMQTTLNKSSLMLRHGAYEYRLNDKVMQIKNNYDKEVFNGDIGVISSVDEINKSLIVNFYERQVKYDILELDELVLSYAITIHKSQGGEFPIVIMPITFAHYIMLQRSLLYTAITRAKKLLILIGQKKAIYYSIHNNNSLNRYSFLSERLREMSN